jgi:predicted DNA-binding transcriptional regulator YafY
MFLGSDIEVLEPRALRTALAGAAKKIASRYA